MLASHPIPGQTWTGPDGRYYSTPGRICEEDSSASQEPETVDSQDIQIPGSASVRTFPTITAKGLFEDNRSGLIESICQLSNRELLCGVEIVIMGNSVPQTDNYVVFQLEQLGSQYLRPEELGFDEDRLRILRNARAIWDFSPSNVQFWQRNGLPSFFVPLWTTLTQASISLGMLSLSRSPPSHTNAFDIDVLLFGTLNDRRLALGESLRQAGLVRAFGSDSGFRNI
ncbi:hypothetical protein CYMTET_44471 [Cymbomonas tetramitiformis]|uniref:Uncharacterized protein n=1 Tax=Cymbomonas tetramitiformis TaxID=36881 RepID=A0AAE0C062_9CHLO|nr:hypothetical protein CYMTET_44471 [Cymbomonas tetramitiformis]